MRAVLLDTVTSANDYALELARAGIPDQWLYVLANSQTSGRGTHGRSWYSPPRAGIYLSVLRTTRLAGLPTTDAFTMAAGVACASVIRELTGLEPRLKPVNDIFIGERKLGGILTEALIESGRMSALVVGLGINLRRFELPPEYGPPVEITSLEQELPAAKFSALRIGGIVGPLVSRLQHAIQAVADGRFEDYRLAYQQFSGGAAPS